MIRKKLNILAGVCILAGLGYMLYVPFTSEKIVSEFCSSIRLGDSVAEVRDLIRVYGLRSAGKYEGREFIHIPPGRIVCRLTYSSNDMVLSAELWRD